jgi:hypothetical protein
MPTQKASRRRTFGTLRSMRNGRIQASYVYDDGRRYYATHTYDSRTDAEGWLANERKLIELGEWSPPEGRAALKALAGVTLREYSEHWSDLCGSRRGQLRGRTYRKPRNCRQHRDQGSVRL